MIEDFFKRLVRQRVSSATVGVKGKAYSARARAQAKAASSFNKAVDAPINKVKGGVKAKAKGVKMPKKGKGPPKGGGGGGGAPQAQKKPKEKKSSGGGMGLFSKKKGAPVEEAPMVEPEAEYGDKTQFIQVVQERPKECVGWVVALNGPLKGLDFRLVTGKNVIGTAADTDIVLTDQYMSSRHAVIRHEEGNFVIVDLDSTNGTFVNDERKAKEELIDNDRIRIGRTEMKFKSLY